MLRYPRVDKNTQTLCCLIVSLYNCGQRQSNTCWATTHEDSDARRRQKREGRLGLLVDRQSVRCYLSKPWR